MTTKPFSSSSHKDDPIEIRLFRATILLTLFVFFFWSVVSFVFDYTLVIKLIYTGSLIIYAAIYVAFRLNVSFNVLSTIYYLLAYLILGFGWLPSGGITGAIMHFFVLVFVSGLLILPLRSYMIFLVMSTLMVVAYGIYEYQMPEAAVFYTIRLNEIRDESVTAVITTIMLGIALVIFKRAHMRDRDRLHSTNQQLGEQKERAESADMAKSKFLATISHEIRTPLNGIIGFSELMGKTKLNKEQEEMLRQLTYSSNLLHGLISDVLDLSIIEDDKLTLHEIEINIKQEIEDVIDTFRPRLESKEGKVSISYEHDNSIPPYTMVDLTRFRQILINLINNAIKFTDEGHIKVRSEMRLLLDEEVRISFSVADTGRGISKDRQKQIFNKFYKANTDYRIEGAGLGLSICKSLVKAMKGEINFESEEGKGSVFYFEIPFNTSEREEVEESKAPLQNSYSHLSILVAEDNKINQMVMTKMLKNIGIESFDVAEDGKEAVDAAERNAYDFILMDVQMPELNGIQAAKAILQKKSDDKKHPVIIAVTANVISGEKEECKKAGMSDFLSKPFTSEMLKEVLSNHM